MSRDYTLHTSEPEPEFRINYAAELNEQQHAAVTAPPGPSLVIAGAGSGKTRTLTYRVAWLLESGVPTHRLLLLTFTNKAAREMMTRVAALMERDLNGLMGGTFHSVGNRILRRHADRLGFGSDFTILDREDAEDLAQTCVDELKVDIEEERFPKKDLILDLLSSAANSNTSIARILEERHREFARPGIARKLERVGELYAARKRATNSMDFDDLLALWLKLLKEHEDVRNYYQSRFQHILVDEFQDTNKIQGEIVDLLAAAHRNVMVVGDDSQSIYSWRGAHFANILSFPDRYAGARTYRIETNYRSSPEILAVANNVIARNTRQHPKNLVAAKPSGELPARVACSDSRQQAAFVGQRILQLRDEGVPLDEMAVLYRSHFHALDLQLQLTQQNIPFAITSGMRFFEQAHIKDVAAALRLLCNPRDEVSFKRMVRLLPGVGGKSADKLWAQYSASAPAVEAAAPSVVPDDPDWSVEEDPAPVAATSSEPPAPRVAVALQACAKTVPKKAAVSWAGLTATLAQMESKAHAGTPAEVIKLFVEGFYEDYCRSAFNNFKNRLDDLDQMVLFAAQQHNGLLEFLSQLALLGNMDLDDGKGRSSDDEEKVVLTTIHQAKGLEFEVIFLIMLNEGAFPSHRAEEDEEKIEEERRLFYVGVTRAKSHLHLCYPVMRFSSPYEGETYQMPSRFLEEISPDLMETWKLKAAPRQSYPYSGRH